MEKGYLLLSDGTCFSGRIFGNPSICCGELVFNTSMTGYSEILTDPSYNGQIVLMTYPLIGNYGVDESWNESCGINATALVVRKLYEGPLPPGRESLQSFMARQNRCGITDVDTRSLTLHIRNYGSQNAVIFPQSMEAEARMNSISSSVSLSGLFKMTSETMIFPTSWRGAEFATSSIYSSVSISS